MKLFEANKTCLKNYKEFSGRAVRSEFWKFILFQFLAMIGLTVVNSILFGPTENLVVMVTTGSDGIPVQSVRHHLQYNSGWLGTIYGFAMLMPTLSVTWRRMHDTGKPGWQIIIPMSVALLISLLVFYFSFVSIPIDQSIVPHGIETPSSVRMPTNPGLALFAWAIGMASIALTIFWLTRKSQPGPNKYGPNPNEGSA